MIQWYKARTLASSDYSAGLDAYVRKDEMPGLWAVLVVQPLELSEQDDLCGCAESCTMLRNPGVTPERAKLLFVTERDDFDDPIVAPGGWCEHHYLHAPTPEQRMLDTAKPTRGRKKR